jgi:hypothetical protein
MVVIAFFVILSEVEGASSSTKIGQRFFCHFDQREKSQKQLCKDWRL